MDPHVLLYALLASCGGVVGTVLVLWKEPLVRAWSVAAIALAAGAMAATAVTHLFPEAVHEAPTTAPYWTLGGFAAFFLAYQLASFHACGQGLTHLHAVGTLALLGILVHSFFDGVAIGAAFSASEGAGRVVSGAVFVHEIPEGAYTIAILLHSGMPRGRAILWSVLNGLLTPVGAAVALSVSTEMRGVVLAPLLGLSAGTFLYVAASNLVPEAQRVSSRRNALAFVLGIALVLGLGRLADALGLGHSHGAPEAPAHDHEHDGHGH